MVLAVGLVERERKGEEGAKREDNEERKKKKKGKATLDPLYFGNTFYKALSITYFVKNSTFGKILKLFIRSDYAEKNCIWLVF